MRNRSVALPVQGKYLDVLAAIALLPLISIAGCAQRSPLTRTAITAQNSSGITKGPGSPAVSHTLMDDGWGLPWGTVKLPVGWGFNGGVIHGGDSCFYSGDQPMWSAESADKSYGVALLPTLKTGYTSDTNLLRHAQQGHCPLLNSTSAADYLTSYILPNLHQGKVEIVSVAPEPQFEQIASQFRQQSAQLERTTRFMRTHYTVQTARLLLRYQEGGRTLNERASTVFACMSNVMVMPPAKPLNVLDCTALITAIGHVPDDGTAFNNAWIDAHSKDPAPFELIPNPAWQQRLQQQIEQVREQQNRQFQQNMQSQKSQFEAGQARYRAQQEMNDQRNAVNNDRRAAMDNANEAFRGYLSDTNIYTNPQTGQQYELSNQYNHTYLNQNGNTALQTDSATSPGVDWTLLVPKH